MKMKYLKRFVGAMIMLAALWVPFYLEHVLPLPDLPQDGRLIDLPWWAVPWGITLVIIGVGLLMSGAWIVVNNE